MFQKFIDKKKSVGYSHPPILQDGVASFYMLDHHGRKLIVTVRELTVDEELDAAERALAEKVSK